MLSEYECNFMIEHLPSLLWALGMILGNTHTHTKSPKQTFFYQCAKVFSCECVIVWICNVSLRTIFKVLFPNLSLVVEAKKRWYTFGSRKICRTFGW